MRIETSNAYAEAMHDLKAELNEVDRWKKWIEEEKGRLSQEWQETKAIQRQSIEDVRIAQELAAWHKNKKTKAMAYNARRKKREAKAAEIKSKQERVFETEKAK